MSPTRRWKAAGDLAKDAWLWPSAAPVSPFLGGGCGSVGRDLALDPWAALLGACLLYTSPSPRD
eukprot:9443830-Alexandrium_andersonii.AAC.1